MRLTARSLAAATVTLLLAAASLAPAAWAVDQPEVLLLRARSLAGEARCSEALPLLERAAAAGASGAVVADLRGQCQIALLKWPAAVASLEEAKRLDPGLPKLDLHLGIARFHAGDLDGAEQALAEARAAGGSGPELDLYEGLIALQRNDDPAAATRLSRARSTDPLSVDPIASYYEGLAWQRQKDADKAREALERVKQNAPDTPWADAADRALQSATATRGIVDRRDIQGVVQAQRPLGTLAEPVNELRRWATLSIGGEYDDNVVLEGNGVQLPQGLSGAGDWRVIWTAEAGAELFRNADWSAGLVAAHYGTAQIDNSEFNTQYPTITGWLDRRLTETTTARLQYDFGYAWVDADPYLVQHTFTPAVFHDWSERHTTRIFTQLVWNNFLFNNRDVFSSQTGEGPGGECTDPPSVAGACGPAGVNEANRLNRDGFLLDAGFDHVHGIHERVSLRGGYSFLRYSSRGSEFSYNGHEARIGARTLVWRDLVVDVQGLFRWLPYRNPSVVPDPKDVPNNGTQYFLSNVDRRDKVWQFDAIVEKPVTDWLIASARYTFVDNDSNTDVYDYTRNIVGGYLTLYWGR